MLLVGDWTINDSFGTVSASASASVVSVKSIGWLGLSMMSTKSDVYCDFATLQSLISLGEECVDVELLLSGHRSC